MKGDIIFEGLPALQIDNNSHLIYSPYRKVFAKINDDAFKNSEISKDLKELTIFDKPTLRYNNFKRVVLTITKKCNLYCKYCFAHSGPYSNEEMTPHIALGIIKYLLNFNKIERIHFTGGEPTLNFETIKAIVLHFEESKEESLPVFYITTNGIIKEEVLKWLMEKSFAFSVSWDGLEEKINVGQRSYITGEKAEHKTRDTILRISQSGLPLRVRIAVSNLNLSYLYESVQWLAENGIKFIHIDPVAPDGRGEEFVKKYTMKNEDFLSEFFRILDFAEDKNIYILNSALANLYTPKDYYCTSMKEKVEHFNPDGSISYCYRVQSFKDKFADYFICGNFDESGKINLDENKSNLLSSIDVTSYPEYYNYFLRNFYSGGCPYRNFANTNSWNKFDNDAHTISTSIYKRAILHIYKRSLLGKPSALEGYTHFYKRLMKDRNNLENNNKCSEIDFIKYNKSHQLEFIPIPMYSYKQSLDIDACDICI